jgi:xylulokinase
MALYLGLDCSTQSLTAILIEVGGGDRRVVFEHALVFDDEYPEYETKHGVLPGPDPLVAATPPLLWAAALDRMMAIVSREAGVNLAALEAIAGSAQQHGSVYLGEAAGRALAALDPRRALVPQIDGIFSRQTAPIWMDASTGAQCEAIERAVGGAEALARLTGSRAFERFTAAQIRKVWEQDPDTYARTHRIHLVSSYMASLLAGAHAPIDRGDGSGMNLMDLARGCWAREALEATAPDLDAKLPPIADSWTIAGSLSPYWTGRYGFPRAQVVVWSGDNPCSLIGTGLVEEGRVAVSLGTSDTLFGFMSAPRVDPSGASHVFASPTGDYMSLICFRNGSLARERVRDEYGLDWQGFSRALRETAPGNGGAVMLPWFEPEITPPVRRAGVRRYHLDPADAPANVRAVVEGQMMAMARHSGWTGVRVGTIHATGGAAANQEILHVMADVFGADVYRFDVASSACLGAALRAFHASEAWHGRPPAWTEVVRGFAEPVPHSRIAPNPAHGKIYADLMEVHARCEAQGRSVQA